jgi:hypothetical protein
VGVSAACYVSSRFPQLCENYRRKTTAIFGNVTYALSIFLEDPSWPYVWKQFPWIAGSLGNLFFDFGMMYQFLKYRRMVDQEEEIEKSGTERELLASAVQSEWSGIKSVTSFWHVLNFDRI